MGEANTSKQGACRTSRTFIDAGALRAERHALHTRRRAARGGEGVVGAEFREVRVGLQSNAHVPAIAEGDRSRRGVAP